MILRKWSYDTRTYEPHEIPDWMTPTLHTNDMSEPVNCTNCTKVIRFGDSFTSKTIHNAIGLGYPVCTDCYAQECKDEQEHRHE